MSITTPSAVLVLARASGNPHHAAILEKLHDPQVMKLLCDAMTPQDAAAAPAARPDGYRP